MARTVKEQEYAAKRNEILDVAERLVNDKGYQGMKIQDILDDLGISKGAFYHYFDSKQALAEALYDRILEESERRLIIVAANPNLTALEKLDQFFANQNRLKNEQQPLMMAVLRGWYDDDNALTRDKMRVVTKRRLIPPLTTIIRQGVEEGVLKTRYPDDAAEVFLTLMEGVADTVARMIIALQPGDDLAAIERVGLAYIDTLERLLGVAPGSLRPGELNVMKDWIESMQGNSR